MAAGTIPSPGSKYGPCKSACQHRDCAENREDAASACRHCGKPIGFDTRMYADGHPRKFVHAACEEAAVEAEQRQAIPTERV